MAHFETHVCTHVYTQLAEMDAAIEAKKRTKTERLAQEERALQACRHTRVDTSTPTHAHTRHQDELRRLEADKEHARLQLAQVNHCESVVR